MPKKSQPKGDKVVEDLNHYTDKRVNLPGAESESILPDEHRETKKVAYPRPNVSQQPEIENRNRDFDPQLVWRGKDEEDLQDILAVAPALYIQERVHPKHLVDDLIAKTKAAQAEPDIEQFDLFHDFNGLPDEAERTDFYTHQGNWTNRMILGDSLQVMASLAEREGLRGKVQCIYIDPPYGIKFNSNFQWSTTSRDVKDGKLEHITREPEMVKAFRDTWRDGIHSYLSYLRDRLTVAKDLLHESGSIFVQIGDENVHRVRAMMDEVFGDENFISSIAFSKTSSLGSQYLDSTVDSVLWYSKSYAKTKYRPLFRTKTLGEAGATQYNFVMELPGSFYSISNVADVDEDRVFAHGDLRSQTGSDSTVFPISRLGLRVQGPGKGGWKTSQHGMNRLFQANRAIRIGNTFRYVRFLKDHPVYPYDSFWADTGISGFGESKVYVVQTTPSVIERCLLMTTDPGDIVLDPTCGSGTTATVAEQWGRRWITIDTSRVALALARTRIMGARYPYYLLADSTEGQEKITVITGKPKSSAYTTGSIRQGFVYERVPHITLRDIANNAEIDVIHDKWQSTVEKKLKAVNLAYTSAMLEASNRKGIRLDLRFRKNPPSYFEEWTVPRTLPFDSWTEGGAEMIAKFKADLKARTEEEVINPKRRDPEDDSGILEIPPDLLLAHAIDDYHDVRIRRQAEIDESIARNANYEYLYDKPYTDKKKVRVAGPFTVESISPHRSMAVDENDDIFDPGNPPKLSGSEKLERDDFEQVIIEKLSRHPIQQSDKKDKIKLESVVPWPGYYICAEGRYDEGGTTRRAGILIGPEFGTIGRADLVEAAKEAAEAGFDVVIACGFSFDAHSADLNKIGRVNVLKARMNADLHMGDSLKDTGKGNLFIIFGEPDIEISPVGDDYQVKILGVDVFDPQKGEIRSDGPEGIACWFIDTDYNGEYFQVRHAYFLGQNDPYKALKTTLKAEINEEAWETLHSDVSRPFPKPEGGRIAVKVINHLGDEVMKVYKIGG